MPKKKWIQKAVKGTKPAGREMVKMGTVNEVLKTARAVRSQIRHGRITYSTGIKRLVMAHNLMKANPNIRDNDRRIRVLQNQIEKTKRLRE